MTRKGFTLIEMIVVVLLIGIMALVAIPNVIKIMAAQNNEKYEAHMKLVKQALDLYTIRYKGDFDNNIDATKYRINYEKLIDNALLIEDGVGCVGVIDLTAKKNSTYNYEYYLTCEDEDDETLPAYVEKNGTQAACTTQNKCVVIND